MNAVVGALAKTNILYFLDSKKKSKKAATTPEAKAASGTTAVPLAAAEGTLPPRGKVPQQQALPRASFKILNHETKGGLTSAPKRSYTLNHRLISPL